MAIKRIKPPSRTMLFLFIMIFMLLFQLSCSSEQSQLEKDPNSLIRPAKLIVVGQKKSVDYLNFPAVIKSRQLLSLSFEVSGVVEELFVFGAQKVKQGEMLAKLDQRDLRTKLKSTRAQYNNAQAEYQRAIRLIKAEAISRSELEKRKSKRDMDKAQLDSAEKAFQDSILVAPFTGNIAKISIQKEQTVQAGEPAISILGTGGFEAVINLPASIVAKATGKNGTDNTSYLVLNVAANKKIPAVFKEVTLDADAVSQTYEVTFSFKAPDDLNILPGMNAMIWIKNPDISESQMPKVNVPITAIAVDGDQKYVWVVNKESMAVNRRNIIVEDGIGSHLNISSGLNEGETIVGAGVSSLSEGMKVRPWSN